MKKLQSGFIFEEIQLYIKLVSVICDAPARAFVKGVRLHNSHYGCDKCNQYGHYINFRMTYPSNDSILYTDESFLQEFSEDHRLPN